MILRLVGGICMLTHPQFRQKLETIGRRVACSSTCQHSLPVPQLSCACLTSWLHCKGMLWPPCLSSQNHILLLRVTEQADKKRIPTFSPLTAWDSLDRDAVLAS